MGANNEIKVHSFNFFVDGDDDDDGADDRQSPPKFTRSCGFSWYSGV